MPVESLSDLARKACVKNIKRLFDIGECPYDLVRSALLKVESPEQLHQIEINSPQIIGRDSEIWLSLIKRDIPNWESKPHQPSNPKNWWKVYRKLQKEAQDDLNQDAEKLKAAFANIKDEKEQNLAQLKTRMELPRPPGSFRQRIAHNYISGKTGSKGAHKLSLMEKIRKENRDNRNLRMATPTKDLKKQASTVTKAPRDFLEEARMPQERSTRISPLRPMTRVAAPPMAINRPSAPSNDHSLLEQEARLRALTNVMKLTEQEAVPISSLDGPSSSPMLSTGIERALKSKPGKPAQPLHQPTTSRPRSSAHFLESGSTIHGSKEAAGSVPRVRSPQPLMTKRKAPQSVFMETKRPKVTSSAMDEFI